MTSDERLQRAAEFIRAHRSGVRMGVAFLIGVIVGAWWL